jgi:energy-coupling factor transporter ATP-binding protein EcfA2
MKDVFISYSHDDEEIAKELATRLESDGVSVWIDYKNGTWGKPFPASIEEGLDETRHILCLMSPNWVNSAWCKIERYSGMVDDPDGFIGKLLPILLSKETKVPRFMKPLVYKDFTKGNALDREYPSIRDHILSTRKPTRGRRTYKLIQEDGYHIPPLGYVFVVGHPGAGKSTFCRVVESVLSKRGIKITRRSDYPFLQALYRLDSARGDYSRFNIDPISEFKVIDQTVYDEALRLIHDEIIGTEVPADELRLIEFSRPHYDSCFLHYTMRALVNSAIVHIDAPILVCKERNERRRIKLARLLAGVEPNPEAFDFDPDMHYVPELVYERYQRAENQYDDQALVLALMPARAYFHLPNEGKDLAAYRDAASKLLTNKITPMIKVPEPLNQFYQRRIHAVEEFVANPPHWKTPSKPDAGDSQ